MHLILCGNITTAMCLLLAYCNRDCPRRNLYCDDCDVKPCEPTNCLAALASALESTASISEATALASASNPGALLGATTVTLTIILRYTSAILIHSATSYWRTGAAIWRLPQPRGRNRVIRQCVNQPILVIKSDNPKSQITKKPTNAHFWGSWFYESNTVIRCFRMTFTMQIIQYC